MEVTENWLIPIIRMMEEKPKIAAVMPKILSYLKRTEITVEYLETNGAHLVTHTSDKLQALKHSGLDCVLISISPFHNEFIPLRHIRSIMQEIVSVFGRQGILRDSERTILQDGLNRHDQRGAQQSMKKMTISGVYHG